MRAYLSLLSVSLALLFSCHGSHPQGGVAEGNHYARGFSLLDSGGYTRVRVSNPWGQARNIVMEYYLVPEEDPVPSHLDGKTVIRTPVDRIICMSTSHLAFLEALGETGKITGVSGRGYITSPRVLKRLEEGLAVDVGYGQNLNFEEIIRQQPGMVMLYGVDSEIAGFLGKFRDLGIPAVVNAEYLEDTPLGKAEWIRFTGAFLDREETADSLFRATEERYLSLQALSGSVRENPEVMVGLPYRDTWWIPGGNSYMARLISDAGGSFAGRENASRESVVISMEEAIGLSAHASLWINTGNVTTKEEILASDSRLASLPAFAKARIYNNNRHATPAGGNDFWESGTVRSDLILEDLIRIFHPGLLPPGELNYYREVL